MKNVNNQTPSLTKTTPLECKNNVNCTFTIATATVQHTQLQIKLLHINLALAGIPVTVYEINPIQIIK